MRLTIQETRPGELSRPLAEVLRALDDAHAGAVDALVKSRGGNDAKIDALDELVAVLGREHDKHLRALASEVVRVAGKA